MPLTEDRHPVRLQIDYDDGTAEYLNGESLNKWLADVNRCLHFMQATRRSMLPDDFMKVEWEKTKPII